MQAIAEGVYWLSGRGSNFYLCTAVDDLLLIDCGMPGDDKVVWQALADLGRAPADLTHLIITHADIDHAGSAAAIVAKSGARVLAGAETAVLLQKGKSPKHMPSVVQWIIDTFVSYGAVAAAEIDTVTPGETLPLCGGLQVLATPGHTPDHISLYSLATGVLFAGDALNTRNDTLQPTAARITADETAATHSAIHLLELGSAVIACGHGAPLVDKDSPQRGTLLNQLRA